MLKIGKLFVLFVFVNSCNSAAVYFYFLPQDRELLKPMMKLIANMHGNEAVGREMLLSLSSYLLRNYGTDPRVTAILDTTDLHILPSLNPDGFEASLKGVCRGYQLGTGRHNGNNVDLNRAFPSWDDLSESSEVLKNRSEPEVAAVIDWVLSQPFVLSANFHDGAVVANYPYDDSHQRNGFKVSCGMARYEVLMIIFSVSDP